MCFDHFRALARAILVELNPLTHYCSFSPTVLPFLQCSTRSFTSPSLLRLELCRRDFQPAAVVAAWPDSSKQQPSHPSVNLHPSYPLLPSLTMARHRDFRNMDLDGQNSRLLAMERAGAG